MPYRVTTTDGRRWDALTPREADEVKRQLIAEGLVWWDMKIELEAEVQEEAA